MVLFVAAFFLLHLFEEQTQAWMLVGLFVIAGLTCLLY